MNNAVNSIWEWSQVFPMVTTHPLAMCMVVACIAMRREDGVNHFFTVIFYTSHTSVAESDRIDEFEAPSSFEKIAF